MDWGLSKGSLGVQTWPLPSTLLRSLGTQQGTGARRGWDALTFLWDSATRGSTAFLVGLVRLTGRC